MPPRDQGSNTPDVPRISRGGSANNSIASSKALSDTDHIEKKSETNSSAKPKNKRINWSAFVPVVGSTILSWALQANARVRQHASACCTGDYCVVNDSAGEMIPEEIVFQCKRPKKNSNATGDPNDIELEDFSVVGSEGLVITSPEYELPWTVPLPIRRTKWNELPEDPVDEVSLKGSSSYISSSDDEEYDFHRKEIETELRRTKRR